MLRQVPLFGASACWALLVRASTSASRSRSSVPARQAPIVGRAASLRSASARPLIRRRSESRTEVARAVGPANVNKVLDTVANVGMGFFDKDMTQTFRGVSKVVGHHSLPETLRIFKIKDEVVVEKLLQGPFAKSARKLRLKLGSHSKCARYRQISISDALERLAPFKNEFKFLERLEVHLEAYTFECSDSHGPFYLIIRFILTEFPSSLKELRIGSGNWVTGNRAMDIAKKFPNSKNLESLRLSGVWLSDEGARAIASDESNLKNLKKLDITGNRMTEHGVQAITQSKTLEGLERLEIGHPGSIDNADSELMAQIWRQTTLRNLKHLQAYGHRLDDVGAQAIAESPSLKNLKYLDLYANRITDVGMRTLLESDLPLEHLILRSNKLTSPGAAASIIATSKNLQQLKFLDLSGTQKTGYLRISNSELPLKLSGTQETEFRRIFNSELPQLEHLNIAFEP